jgi:hypothetical protein
VKAKAKMTAMKTHFEPLRRRTKNIVFSIAGE